MNNNEKSPVARIAVFLLAYALAPCWPAAHPETIDQSARAIPVTAQVDVVVVGGTVAAVAAAVEAADAGAEVMLVAPRTYLGEDICGTLRLWLEDDETPGGELTQRIFADRRTTTPMHAKKVLEAALLKREIEFLFGSYASDVLVDDQGRPAGIVIANRAGRQAVGATVIIDATERGTVAKMAGAESYPWKAGKHACRRVVLGGESTSAAESAREVPAGVDFSGRPLHYIEYSLDLDLGDGTFGAVAAAEGRARDLTYRKGQLRAAERMTFIPPDRVRGRAPAATWKQGQPWAIDHFRAANINRLYVLGPAADIPQSTAE
ncbi:MAG: FAD-dependent oxidoreductase, partial [Planctomycetes bacterium]|nr:FAD-dependent oxidoreductase [Planctomycetota bacterium]